LVLWHESRIDGACDDHFTFDRSRIGAPQRTAEGQIPTQGGRDGSDNKFPRHACDARFKTADAATTKHDIE